MKILKDFTNEDLPFSDFKMSRVITVSKDRTIFAIGNDNELKVKNIRNDKSTSGLLCSTKSEGSIQVNMELFVIY